MNAPEPSTPQALQTALQLTAAGERLQAIAQLEASLTSPPDQPELLLLLIELLLVEDNTIQLAELEQWLLKPSWQSDFRVLHQLGRCRQALGDPAGAAALYARALALGAPEELTGAQLAAALLAQEQWQEAEALLQPLCAAQPNRIDLLSNLAIALLRQNQLTAALEQLDAALALCQAPDHSSRADLLLNRGTVLQELGQRQEAARAYQSALAEKPHLANVRTNLGLLAYLDREFAAAESWYRQSLQRAPHDSLAAVNLAGLLLIQGGASATEGWKLYERRFNGPSQLLSTPLSGALRWHGEALDGPLLLVHEQGLGDTFQFIRYAALLKVQGQRCFFHGPAKLH